MPVTAPLPNGYAVTVGTSNQLGAPPNPGRSGVMFINNSGGGQLISICPSTLYTIASGATPALSGATSTPAGIVGAATQGVPGTNLPGSITLSPGQSFTIDGSGGISCTGAFNAISSAAGGALTVLES